jgi:cell division protein FtsI/penicillin-binding protein 2
MAYDPDPLIPWSRHLANALFKEWRGLGHDEATKRYGTLAIDRGLQSAAQEFVASQGRQRHVQLLAERGAREALPPRIALAILDLPSGEVVALGGWPRMNSSRQWLTSPSGDIPSVDWVEDHAPRSLRRRYAGDRNFDRMVMGSATKPVLASAALAVHKNLDQQLAVRGPAGRENEVFGIPLVRPWHVPNSASLTGQPWCDFKSYLAKSDNRFHIRLGFLALADPDEQYKVASAGVSASHVESMDGGASEWGKYPKFADSIGFGPHRPNDVLRLQDSPFAAKLSSMYGIGIQRGDVTRRYSLWTRDEGDDKPPPTEAERKRRLRFSAISPEAPQFAFDRLTQSRAYVSLLLGGDENMWANVEFAAAFASAVQGLPITAHITRGTVVESQREKFPEIAKKLRPGLEAVIENPAGTAHSALSTTGALSLLHGLTDYKLYGKTGTLAESEDRLDTSRFVITIVRHDNAGKITKGVVLSLVIERGQVGMAARWMGEFIVRYWDQIRARLA